MKAKELFKSIGNFLAQIFTDARGRPEIKMILGVPIIIIAVVFLLIEKLDLEKFGALSGLGALLIGATTVADGFIDRDNRGAL